MFRLKGAVFVLLWGTLFAGTASTQPGDRHLDMKARVLDVLFRTDVIPQPYYLKLVLRFGDSDSQIIVVIYPGGKSEIIRYTVRGMDNKELEQMITKAIADNPKVNEQDIAATLKVDINRSATKYELLEPALNELKAIRISPILATRTATDDSSEYEFSCDTWQEYDHYVITGPFHREPQDKLVQWMLKFRANLPHFTGIK